MSLGACVDGIQTARRTEYGQMAKLEAIRALVTGGTSGIGASIAQRLRAEGAAVVCTGRNETRGREVAATMGAEFVRADVRDPAAVAASVQAAVAKLGGLDALVANAGVLHEAPLSATTDEDWDAVLGTNLVGCFRYAVACLPHLRAAGGGSITMVSSDAGVWGETSIAAYSVSKRAVNMLVQTLAVEAGPHGIRVNAVCPGDTAPGMATYVAGRDDSADPDTWTLPPLARVGTGADVAGAVTFFASSDGSFCNGSILLVDGGMRAAVQATPVARQVRPGVSDGLEGGFGLVTGSMSDIARACAERLRSEGMTIVEIGGGDDARRASEDQAIEQALAANGGRIDVLVTNSERTSQGSIEAIGEEEFAHVVDANLTAAFRAGRACFAPMRSSGGGSIIHVASDAGIRPVHESAAYSVACAGVIAVAELFAAEGAPHGIRANAVCPGGVTSGEDVAAVVAWLAGAESAPMSGATLRVDGGAGAAMVADTRG
jgi:meso-butanediol dehydrogenase/(S,S)-butanediol dehydrogenase/diacetyl reductase